MSFRYVILIFLITIFGYLLKTQLSCADYNGNFHYSSHVISFHLNELITTENQAPIFIVRLFHNKITVLMFDIFSRYIQFFNISYLINIIGLAGLFGLFYFYYSIVANKIRGKIIKIFAVIVLLLPFLEIFQLTKLSFFLRALYLMLPYQAAALIGLFFSLKEIKRIPYGIYFLLLILTIGWIIVFKNDALSFCTA